MIFHFGRNNLELVGRLLILGITYEINSAVEAAYDTERKEEIKKIENLIVDTRDLNDLKTDICKLNKILTDITTNQKATFGSYIYEYMYEQYLSKEDNYKGKEKYEEILDDEILFKDFKNRIKNAFKDNGMGSAGTLDKAKTRGIRQLWSFFGDSGFDLNSVLKRRSSTIAGTRDKIFVFGFGLNMDNEDVSRLLVDGLLTYDFNPKDWRECIYYWCLKPENKGKRAHPYDYMIELVETYNNINITEDEISGDTSTQIYKNELKSAKCEADIINLLKKLKINEQSKPAIRSIQQQFTKETLKIIENLDKLVIPIEIQQEYRAKYETAEKRYEEIEKECKKNESS